MTRKLGEGVLIAQGVCTAACQDVLASIFQVDTLLGETKPAALSKLHHTFSISGGGLTSREHPALLLELACSLSADAFYSSLTDLQGKLCL